MTQSDSPDDEHDVLETCRELKIKINTQKRIVRHVGHLPRREVDVIVGSSFLGCTTCPYSSRPLRKEGINNADTNLSRARFHRRTGDFFLLFPYVSREPNTEPETLIYQTGLSD